MTEYQTIADEANHIINGPRRSDYGPVEDSLGGAAQIWSVVLGVPVTATQVALCMVGLKLQREGNFQKRDNRVDMIGYLLLADKLADQSPSAKLNVPPEAIAEPDKRTTSEHLELARKMRVEQDLADILERSKNANGTVTAKSAD